MTTEKTSKEKGFFRHTSGVGYKDLKDVRLRGYFTSELGVYGPCSDGVYLEYMGEFPTQAQSKMLII